MTLEKRNFIIIINYNNYQDTIECIASIKQQTNKFCVPVIVDNASTNESVKVIKNTYPDCVLIENNDNLGFSGANNIGADYALKENADIITFLNNDMVLLPNFFEVILDEIEDNQCICPLMLYYDDKNLINYAGGYFDYKKGAGTTPDRGKPLNDRVFQRKEVTLAHGGCCVMTAKTYLNLGPWKTEYFLYREDDEYSARMATKGISVIFEPRAVLYHKENASTGTEKGSAFRNYYLMRNRLYNIKLYKLGIMVEIRAITSAILNYSRYLLLGKQEYKYNLKAVMDFKRGKMGRESSIG